MNPNLALFKSLLIYDRPKALRYLKNAEKQFLSCNKNLIKGYSSLNKIPDKIIENRVEKKLQSDESWILPTTLFTKLVWPTAKLFNTIFSSQSESSIKERIITALRISSFFSGWPFETVVAAVHCCTLKKKIKSILSETIDPVQIDVDETVISGLREPESLWRVLFSLHPEYYFGAFIPKPNDPKVLSDTEFSYMSNPIDLSSVYNKIDQLVSKSAIKDKEKEKHLINLLLLSISLKDNALIEKGLFLANNLHSSSDNMSVPLGTTLALCSLALKEFQSALKYAFCDTLEELLQPEILGFLGNILASSGRGESAIPFFALAFTSREYPCTWPLHYIMNIEKSFFSGFPTLITVEQIPFDNTVFGKSMDLFLGNKFPNLYSHCEEILRNIKSSAKSKSESENTKDQTTEQLPTKLQSDKLQIKSEELSSLTNDYFEVINLEESITRANSKKDWQLIANFALNLKSLWDEIFKEIKKYSNFEVSLPEKPSANDLLIFIQMLDVAIQAKNKETSVKFKTDLRFITDKLTKLSLSNLIPSDNISYDEFYRIKPDLEKKIHNELNFELLLKGEMSEDDFLKIYNNNTSRREVLLKILRLISDHKADYSANLLRLIHKVDWNALDVEILLPNYLKMFALYEKNIRDSYNPLTVYTFLSKISCNLKIPVLQLIFSNDYISQYFSSLAVANQIEIPLIEHILLSEDVIKSDIFKYFPLLKKKADFSICIGSSILHSKLKNDKKIKILSILYNNLTKLLADTDKESIIPILCFIKDLLIEDQRQGEAILLAYSAWVEYHDEAILTNLECPMLQFMEDLLNRGEESTAIAKSMLEMPNWIIDLDFGYIYYLYFCHKGNFQDLYEQSRYAFYKIHEEYKLRFPVLIDLYFDRFRFSTNVQGDVNSTHQDTIMTLQAIDNFEHDIRRITTYKSWYPATNYQKLFNEKLIQIKTRITSLNDKTVDDFENYLKGIRAEEWINDANKKLDQRAKSPATELMKKYIQEQIERLKILLIYKKRHGFNSLDSLRHNKVPLREKLLKEKNKNLSAPENILQIYDKLLETI